MSRGILYLLLLCCLVNCLVFASQLDGCGDECQSDDDCLGELGCIDGQCGDDTVCGGENSSEEQDGCGDECQSDDDCLGELGCTDGQCQDDPSVGTQLCNKSVDKPESPPASDNNPKESVGGSCKAASFLEGSGHSCNTDNNAECCESGTTYPQFECSPPVSDQTGATLTLNSFSSGGDGGDASECDGEFHDDSDLVVALSTGWFSSGKRCGQKINIFANGKSVEATVVDECDSLNGCDDAHAFQPPCSFNIVDASRGVWEQLGISEDDPQFGFMQITWADA